MFSTLGYIQNQNGHTVAHFGIGRPANRKLLKKCWYVFNLLKMSVKDVAIQFQQKLHESKCLECFKYVAVLTFSRSLATGSLREA
jgi:hypothetical protein